jgi:hypothetical protein
MDAFDSHFADSRDDASARERERKNRVLQASHRSSAAIEQAPEIVDGLCAKAAERLREAGVPPERRGVFGGKRGWHIPLTRTDGVWLSASGRQWKWYGDDPRRYSALRAIPPLLKRGMTLNDEGSVVITWWVGSGDDGENVSAVLDERIAQIVGSMVGRHQAS